MVNKIPIKTLPEIIEQAYRIFGKYTISNSLFVCSPHCVSKEDVDELVKTPLRQVSKDLLHISYYESARNFSDRELWEMKHFLPRVLEMVSNFEFPCHSEEIVFTRLDLNESEKWPKEERAVLDDFAKAFFKKCLSTYPIKLFGGIETAFSIFGAAHFDMKPLLEVWEDTNMIESLLHFKDFIYFGVRSNKDELTNSFIGEEATKVFFDWYNSPTVVQKFIPKIETIILNSQAEEANLEELSMLYETLTLK